MRTMYCAPCAQELRDGDIVNLGIGLPTDYLPEGIHNEIGKTA